VRSVLFRAPLEEYLTSGARQFEIEQPGLKASLITYGDGRWVLMFSDDVERDEDTLRAAVLKAIGYVRLGGFSAIHLRARRRVVQVRLTPC